MLVSTIFSIITAVGMGLLLGFILQRGRFCLNSAFRDIIFMKDMNLFVDGSDRFPPQLI